MQEMWVSPLLRKITWRRKWQPVPVFLPGKFHGQRSLAGYSPRGCKELGTTEHTQRGKTMSRYWIKTKKAIHKKRRPALEDMDPVNTLISDLASGLWDHRFLLLKHSDLWCFVTVVVVGLLSHVLFFCDLKDWRSIRLLCPWDFPGKNTGVDCHFLLQGIFPTLESNSCLLHWQVDSLPLSQEESWR